MFATEVVDADYERLSSRHGGCFLGCDFEIEVEDLRRELSLCWLGLTVNPELRWLETHEQGDHVCQVE